MADVVAKFKLEDGSELPIGKSFISSLKSVSESTADASSINYGTLANSGSIEIQDGNGYISKMIDDGSLPISDLDVDIEVNGEVFQHHITTDSDYNTEDNILNISLSNFIKDFDILKYKGYPYPDESRTLYELFVDVLNSYFKTTTEIIDSMFNSDVLEYIKNIKIQYPVIEYGKTYRNILDELCTIAQLNMFATKDNSLKFISARPVYINSEEIKTLNFANISESLKYTKPLKNKYDGVELTETNVVLDDKGVIFSSDSLSVYDTDKNYIAENEGVNPPSYKFFQYTMEYVGYIRVDYEFDLKNSTKPINPNRIDDIKIKLNLNSNKYSFIVKSPTLELTSESISLGYGTDSQILIPVNSYDGKRPSVVMTRVDNSTKLKFSIYLYRGGLQGGGYTEGTHPYSYLQTFTFDILKTTLSFNQISANTSNIEDSKTKTSVNSSNLLQTSTTYNSNKISDIIKSNILNDYRSGISDGKLTLNKDLVEIGDLVKYPNDRRVWRVVGKEFDYDGEYLFPVSVMQCFKPYSQYGLFNEFGDTVYTWDELIQDNLVSLSPEDSSHIMLVSKQLEGTLKMPETITSIGGYSFEGCSKLDSVELSSKITKIPKFAFYGCSNLKTITNINNVISLGESAFDGCSSLSSAIIPEQMTQIPKRLFAGCSSLKEINIPESITEISTYAFHGCSGFTSIVVPDSVLKIGIGAFNGCISISKITLPFIGKQLSGYDFTYVDDWYFGYIFSDESEQYYSYNQYVPSSVKTVNITAKYTYNPAIGQGAFESCRYIRTVNIPNADITEIPYALFLGCESLEYFNLGNTNYNMIINGENVYTTNRLPYGTTTIQGSAFNGCYNLQEITIPKTVTRIHEYAFINTGLETVYYTSTEDYKNNNLNITISDYDNTWDYVTWIYSEENLLDYIHCELSEDGQSYILVSMKQNNGSSFADSKFTIPETYTNESGLTLPIKQVGKNTYGDYRDCVLIEKETGNIINSITEVVFPESVETVAPYSFYGCSSLEIARTENVKHFGEYAFYGCSSMIIGFLNKAETVGISLFENSGIAFVSFDYESGTLTYLPERFCYNTKLQNIAIISSIKSIGVNAFGACQKFTDARFDVTTGWTANGVNLTLEDGYSSTNATLLKSTYVGYKWTRS